MLCPISCFTCGKIISDKWLFYQRELAKIKKSDDDSLIDITADETFQSPESIILDKLGLTRYCCRRILLSHKDFN